MKILTRFLAVLVLNGTFLPCAVGRDVSVASPGGDVEVQVRLDEKARLSYRVTFRKRAVLEDAPLGIVVDGVHLGQGVELGKPDAYRVHERYATRGVHAEAVNHGHGAKVPVRHLASKTGWTLEVRAYDDGVAFRYVVPGEGKPRVPDEATAFRIPAGSTAWYHDLEGHYEGVHVRKPIDDVKPGQWAAPPLTIRLKDGGYLSLTESALVNYSGMVLQADGDRTFRARLGHAAPASYPFRLRFAKEVERLAKPAAVTGTITSPWRVALIAADLNTLVNSDLVQNLAPPPDPKLFPKGFATDWLRPGRCVWKFLDGGASTLAEMKEFSRLAGELGFEYHLVEGFWQKWSDEQLRELIDYSNKHGVKVWLWKHRRDLATPEQRRKFFRHCRDAGVAGVKLDFFDHEAKEVIDLYQAALRDAAEHRLMVNFHGANKPAGEARTWPNEMTREGIYGLEHRKMATWPAHNTTLPFTRMLAGHADYTPMIFGERRRDTSWAHQIATVAVFTSPLLVFAAHPATIAKHPAADLIKSIPSVWDETIALPSCEIGEVAAFARWRGDTWFLAVLNGPAARTLKVPLTFLGAGEYQALVIRDRLDDPAAIVRESITSRREDVLSIELRAGGGAIARFAKPSR
jgi:alpha-glucosidase